MLRRIRPEAVICYGKPFEEMKGRIIAVDYAETNNLSKSCHIKTLYNRVDSMIELKGGGSAGGSSSGNPIIFNEETDMPGFPGWENKAPGKDFEWRGNSASIGIKEVGTIPKQKKSITMILTTLTGNNHIGTIKIQTVGTKVTEYFRMVLGKGKCWNWRR